MLAPEAVRKSLLLLKNGKDQKELHHLYWIKQQKKKYRLQEDVLKIGSHCGGWMIAWHEESGKISQEKMDLRKCF